MLMIIYTILAMVATPFLIERFNRHTRANGTVQNFIRGWPAYIVNVIVCGVLGLGAVFFSADRSLWNWIIRTALIYFGNQFVYNSFVKIYMRAKARL